MHTGSSFKYFYSFLYIITLSFNFKDYVIGEKTCSWNAEGNQVCEDEEASDHNVWTESDHGATHLVKPLLRGSFNELELEIFVKFFAQLKDWKPTRDSLAKYDPEALTLAVIRTFNEFDENDDGHLDYHEIEAKIHEKESEENLPKIKKLLRKFKEEKLSVFEYLEVFFKLGDGEVTKPLLEPYLRLRHLAPGTAKKIMQGSCQMFIDSDKDQDRKLDKDEFFSGMKKSYERMGSDAAEGKITNEQLQGLFELVDKDDDEFLSFSEFQATIPEPPKSMEDSMHEIFLTADLNADGFLSKTEFGSHMKDRAAQMKIKVPTEDEITEIYEKLDLDDDENLNPTEMFTLFQDAKAMREKKMTDAFASFDKDADGLISLNELEEIVKAMEQTSGQKVDAKVFMNMLDKDNDGKVSIDELQLILSSTMN